MVVRLLEEDDVQGWFESRRRLWSTEVYKIVGPQPREDFQLVESSSQNQRFDKQFDRNLL
jgi:hypothetical protein